MSEDDTSLLAMWDAKMSTASIASILGKREATVANRLGALRAARDAETESARPPLALDAALSFPVLPPPLPPAPPAPPLILAANPGRDTSPAYLLFTGPIGSSMDKAPPINWPAFEVERRPPPGKGVGGAMQRIFRPEPPEAEAEGISPDVLRWCRQFKAAHWPVREIAWLFDLKPVDLLEALAGG